jgi:hypothetical protein
MHEEEKPAPDVVPDPAASAADPAHTDAGAPTNQAHRDAGDGTLIGSVPAGLSPKELEDLAQKDQLAEGGTG